MESYYYLLYFFWICVLSPHVVHKEIQEKSVGETHHDDRMEFIVKIMKIRKQWDKNHARQVGPKQARELAAWPPTWADRPTTASPHLVLCPRSSLSSIHSIFTCYAFRFEPN
jgi:hypothetical protein